MTAQSSISAPEPVASDSHKLLRYLVQNLPSEYLTHYGIDMLAIALAGNVNSYSSRRWLSGTFSKKALLTFVHISANAKNPAERGRITEHDLLPFLLA